MDNKQIGYLGIGAFIFLVVMGFGIVFSSTLSYVARDNTITDVTGITLIVNGSLTNLGSSYPYVQDVTDCINTAGTVTLTEANYTVVTGTSTGSGGFVLEDTASTLVGQDFNCTVQYLKSTTASNAIIGFLVIFSTVASLFIIVVLFIIIKPLVKDLK